MGSSEDRERHSQRRKKDIYAKALRDTGDHKGAFRLRVINPRKGEYKRVKLDPKTVELEEGLG